MCVIAYVFRLYHRYTTFGIVYRIVWIQYGHGRHMVRICLIIISRFNLLVWVINDGVFKATGQGGCGTRVGARSRSPPPQKKRNIIFFKFHYFTLGGGGAFCYFCSMLGAFLGQASKEGGGIKYFSYVIKYS